MKEKIFAAFIVLHYKTQKETIKCVESIQRIKKPGRVVTLIIDNASNDGSIEKIKEKYIENENILIIINDDNLGYSKANNKGFLYLKNRFDPKYIVLLNNDTVIRQKDFLLLIERVNENNKYDFIGPDVYAPSLKVHQNPLYNSMPTINQQIKEVEKIKDNLNNIDKAVEEYNKNQKLIKIKSYVPYPLIYIYKKIINDDKFFIYTKRIENPILMGACIIVTDKYISEYDIIFQPETSFYYEEIILGERCKKLHLECIYDPRIRIKHLHSVSTRKMANDVYKYIRFINENTLNSFHVFYDYYKTNDYNKK